jgi:ribosome-binding protein aMBF1 (putative translation factor)
LNPTVQAARRAALDRANEVLRQRKAAGLHKPAGWSGRDPKAISAKGHARLAELRGDPAWRDAFARKVSEARGGRLQVTCVVCGVLFTEPHSHRRRQTCSPACLTALRASRDAHRRDAVAHDRDRRRTAGIALGHVRRQRGLSIERLARQTGLSPAHVSRIERGLNTPSLAALSRLADALGASPFPPDEAPAGAQPVNGNRTKPSGESVTA